LQTKHGRLLKNRKHLGKWIGLEIRDRVVANSFLNARIVNVAQGEAAGLANCVQFGGKSSCKYQDKRPFQGNVPPLSIWLQYPHPGKNYQKFVAACGGCRAETRFYGRDNGRENALKPLISGNVG
jgi:hypothetical protein